MKDGENPFNRIERRDAAINRQRILDTASRLFEQLGVEKVSMNQIALEAQIGPGTLYRRYRNKGELCLDLIKDNVVMLFDDIDVFLDQNQSKPPDQRLRGILSLFIRFRESKAQLLKGVEEFETVNRPKSKVHNPLYDELHQHFVHLFDEIAASEDGQTNTIFKADLLLAALSSNPYFFQRDVRGYSPEELLEQLMSIFARA